MLPEPICLPNPAPNAVPLYRIAAPAPDGHDNPCGPLIAAAENAGRERLMMAANSLIKCPLNILFGSKPPCRPECQASPSGQAGLR